MSEIRTVSRSPLKTIVAAALLFVAAFPALAEEPWSLAIGGGALAANTYSGAEEFFVSPLPFFRASYAARKTEFFASSIDGLGFNYVDRERRLFASGGVNLGEKRDSEQYSAIILSMDHRAETKRFLTGSPTAWNPASVFGMLGWISPFGILASALYYQPTLVTGETDELFHAFVPSVFWLAPLQLTDRLKFTCFASLDFMDRRYAAAWFSVEEPTGELEAFTAEAGLRDVQLIVSVTYAITERIAATLLAGNLYLLADAADSPYTQTPYRLKAGAYLSYAFRY